MGNGSGSVPTEWPLTITSAPGGLPWMVSSPICERAIVSASARI